MSHHVKGISKNVKTGEVETTYFTDEEWAVYEQARLDAAAAEANRDLKQELLDTIPPGMMAFLKVYADREGLTYKDLFAIIKGKME